MGLNYNFLLYFKREHLWDALQGVVKIAEPYDPPPTTIHFTDQGLNLPIATGSRDESKLHHDKPEFNFAISLISKKMRPFWNTCSVTGMKEPIALHRMWMGSNGSESRQVRRCCSWQVKLHMDREITGWRY
jgi:hypothetical protein